MIPRDDLIEHEAEECVCGPARIPIVAGDGTRSRLVIHRRLDSRGDEPAPVEQWEGGSAR